MARVRASVEPRKENGRTSEDHRSWIIKFGDRRGGRDRTGGYSMEIWPVDSEQEAVHLVLLLPWPRFSQDLIVRRSLVTEGCFSETGKQQFLWRIERR